MIYDFRFMSGKSSMANHNLQRRFLMLGHRDGRGSFLGLWLLLVSIEVLVHLSDQVRLDHGVHRDRLDELALRARTRSATSSRFWIWAMSFSVWASLLLSIWILEPTAGGFDEPILAGQRLDLDSRGSASRRWSWPELLPGGIQGLLPRLQDLHLAGQNDFALLEPLEPRRQVVLHLIMTVIPTGEGSIGPAAAPALPAGS